MELYKLAANRQKYQATDDTVRTMRQELKARRLRSEGTLKQLHELMYLGYMRLLPSFHTAVPVLVYINGQYSNACTGLH